MVTDARVRLWSDLAIPPGELLQEELDAIGMTQQELALRAGRPPQVINEIVRGKKAITSETALELEKVLGIPAHIWTGLEDIYRMTLARNQERSLLEKQVDRLKEFPVAEMEKRGWLPRDTARVEKVRALLKFFGAASFDTLDKKAVADFRITGRADISKGALLAWLRKGELEGRQVETQRFEPEKFAAIAHKNREFTNEAPEVFYPKMKELCADAGVAVVCIPELPKSGANGVARWLSREKALIQLSLRWRWADIWWFSFFHECHHVLTSRLKEVHIDGLDGDPRVEADADTYARDILISPGEWERFMNAGDRSRLAVLQFARQARIAPGIIVGRMQHEDIIPHNHLNGLRVRFVWGQKANN